MLIEIKTSGCRDDIKGIILILEKDGNNGDLILLFL